MSRDAILENALTASEKLGIIEYLEWVVDWSEKNADFITQPPDRGELKDILASPPFYFDSGEVDAAMYAWDNRRREVGSPSRKEVGKMGEELTKLGG